MPDRRLLAITLSWLLLPAPVALAASPGEQEGRTPPADAMRAPVSAGDRVRFRERVSVRPARVAIAPVPGRGIAVGLSIRF